MAAPVPDLVPQARLGMLRNSLEKVRSVLDDLRHARELLATRAEADTAQQLLESIGHVVEKVRKLQKDVSEMFAKALTADVLDPLESAQRDAGSAESSALVRKRLELETTKVGANLASAVKIHMLALDRLDIALAAARAAESPERETLLAEVWVDYVRLDGECRSVFREYVDLVRGVLFRDAELDDHLFRIADELVRPWGVFGDFGWASVTIPASREGGSMSTARLIRVGFPEWSIWVLPVAVHELGHFVVENDVTVKAIVSEAVTASGITFDEVRSWAAAAFATVVMGPAYVWASLLLRTDPSLPDDRRRVAVMLAMLDLLSAGEADTVEYREVVAEMADTWQSLLAQAVPNAAPEPGAVTQQIAKLVDDVYQGTEEPFEASAWSQAKAMSQHLLDKPAEEIARPYQVRHLRHVLVAAWHARIELGRAAPEADETLEAFAANQKQRVADLALKTREVCIALIDGMAESQPPQGQSGRSRAAGAAPRRGHVVDRAEERRGPKS